MKKNILIAIICLFTITTFAEKKETASKKETVTFRVAMDCQGCVDKINNKLTYEKGVKAIECDIEKQTVKVTYRADKTNIENLKTGFAKIGYKDVKVIAPSCNKTNNEEVKKCCGSHKH